MATPTGAVRAMLTMTVPASATAEFEQEWRQVSQWVQRQPGCLRQTLTRIDEQDVRYVITSDWTDSRAYHQFETSPSQDDRTAGLRRLRLTVAMDVLTIIDHKEFQ